MCISLVSGLQSGLQSKFDDDNSVDNLVDIIKPITIKEQSCLDSKNKPSFPLEQANYNCAHLTSYGNDRCNKIYGGNVCRWITSKKCQHKTCRRNTKYELHYGKYIDVGRCDGICKNTKLSCSLLTYSSYMVDYVNSVQIIDSCNCATDRSSTEIPTNKCVRNCNEQKNNICQAGIDENFNSNNLEPSIALLSGILSSCSVGVQSGFDIFIDNRCFGHTFTECFSEGGCPLRAAMVALTQTDSLILCITTI